MAGQRILIVDDDISVGTVVKMTLDDSYDVAVTTRAETAYKFLSKHKVDLVLLDIKMPNINGIDALVEIKLRHPETIVIMLTAYATRENIQKVKSLGAHGIINKPFEVDELRNYIDNTLSGSEAENRRA